MKLTSTSNEVFPLGSNYQVASHKQDFFKLQRTAFYSGKNKTKATIKGLRLDVLLGNKSETERLDNLESHPDFGLEPKVLFMTRVWDTNHLEARRRKETEALNEKRVECVRALREAFGRRFFGGLAYEGYAVKHYKDCLLPNNNLSNKRVYLETQKGYPVCVATTGLNNSNGWKLSEYVAFSKAIVTEPLVYQVPGSFAKDTNYLQFTNVDELVGATAQLFENKHLRCAMMMNNYRYYRSYVRPDALILNSLAVVSSRSDL